MSFDIIQIVLGWGTHCFAWYDFLLPECMPICSQRQKFASPPSLYFFAPSEQRSSRHHHPPCGTRAHNLRIRGPMPCPLGQGGSCWASRRLSRPCRFWHRISLAMQDVASEARPALRLRVSSPFWLHQSLMSEISAHQKSATTRASAILLARTRCAFRLIQNTDEFAPFLEMGTRPHLVQAQQIAYQS